jgi:hypothetical protein
LLRQQISSGARGNVVPAGQQLSIAQSPLVLAMPKPMVEAFDRRPKSALSPVRQLPRPPRGSSADRWLRRAGVAVASLRRQTDSEPDQGLRAQVSDVDDRAVAIFADLERFAGQVTLIDDAAKRINAVGLYRERDALRRTLGSGPVGTRQERERSLRSVDEQLAAYQRLTETRDGLLAKMQSTVLGLDGLVARLAELSTMHTASDVARDTASRVRLLTEDLDGLRSGLAGAEALSRQVLAGGPPPEG